VPIASGREGTTGPSVCALPCGRCSGESLAHCAARAGTTEGRTPPLGLERRLGGVTLGRSQGEEGRWPSESQSGSPATALLGGRGGEGEDWRVTLGRSQGREDSGWTSVYREPTTTCLEREKGGEEERERRTVSAEPIQFWGRRRGAA
jgi:hypothetical protein